MLPTVGQVLDLAPFRRADPHVLAARHHLDRRVRWVHASELSDIAKLLRGGELILTTGIALPASAAGLERYVRELADTGIAALGVELGRRYREALPKELLRSAERHELPLVELRRETPFVAMTEAVHMLILDDRTQELIASEEAHRAFTELTIAGLGPQQVVDLVASMARRPVVYENLLHQVLTFNCAGVDPDTVLADWESRSRAAYLGAEQSADPSRLAVGVKAFEGSGWGQLVMLCDGTPSQREQMLLERGATALVINRLATRDLDNLERQTHRTLLTALTLTNEMVPSEVAARAQALGVPLERRSLTGVVVRVTSERGDFVVLPALLRDVAGQAALALEGVKVAALIGPLDDQQVAVLLAEDRRPRTEDTVTRLSGRLHALSERWPDVRLTIGVGGTVVGVDRARYTLREAMQVADTAEGLSERRPFFRPPDLRLRGLAYLLRDEAVVQDYVERQLGPLLAHDATRGTHLHEFVEVYCREGGNKSAVAAALFVSRAAVYERVVKVEKILGVDLADAEDVLALHFAVLARAMMRRPDKPWSAT